MKTTNDLRHLDRLIVLRINARLAVVGIDECGRLMGVDGLLPHKAVSYIAGCLSHFCDTGKLSDFKDGIDEQHDITWSVHRLRKGRLVDADAFRAAMHSAPR